MTPHNRILSLLSPPEIAILLGLDAKFDLPAGVPFGRIKMRAARELVRRCGIEIEPQTERQKALATPEREPLGIALGRRTAA